jgi:hypothetical protein
MSDGREEREEQEQRRKWREKEEKEEKDGGVDRPYREREWEDRGREPS